MRGARHLAVMQKRIYQQQKQASAEEKAKPPEGYGTLHAQNEVVSAGVLPKPAGPIEKVRAHPLPSQWRNEDVLKRHERVINRHQKTVARRSSAHYARPVNRTHASSNVHASGTEQHGHYDHEMIVKLHLGESNVGTEDYDDFANDEGADKTVADRSKGVDADPHLILSIKPVRETFRSEELLGDTLARFDEASRKRIEHAWHVAFGRELADREFTSHVEYRTQTLTETARGMNPAVVSSALRAHAKAEADELRTAMLTKQGVLRHRALLDALGALPATLELDGRPHGLPPRPAAPNAVSREAHDAKMLERLRAVRMLEPGASVEPLLVFFSDFVVLIARTLQEAAHELTSRVPHRVSAQTLAMIGENEQRRQRLIDATARAAVRAAEARAAAAEDDAPAPRRKARRVPHGDAGETSDAATSLAGTEVDDDGYTDYDDDVYGVPRKDDGVMSPEVVFRLAVLAVATLVVVLLGIVVLYFGMDQWSSSSPALSRAGTRRIRAGSRAEAP